LAARYDSLLALLAPMVRLPDRSKACAPAWHLYVVLIDFKALAMERATIMDRLRKAGIGTQVHYIPVHHQTYYRNRYGALNLPGSDDYYSRALSLPLFPAMDDSDVDRVVDTLHTTLEAA